MYKKYQKAGSKTDLPTNLAPDPVIGNQMDLGFDFDCDTGAGKTCRNRGGRPMRLGITGSLEGKKGSYGQPTNLGPGWNNQGEYVENKIGTDQDYDLSANIGGYLRTDLATIDKNWNPLHLNLGYNRHQNLMEGTGSNNLTAKLAHSGDQFTGNAGHSGFFGNKGGSSRPGFSYGLQSNYNLDTKRVDNIGAFGRIGMLGPLGISGHAGINPQTGKPNFGAGMSMKFKKGGVRKYQKGGHFKYKGTQHRDLHPDLIDAINQVDAVYGGKDLLTYTAIAESTGGWNPKAGQNYMQIMKPGFEAVLDTKSHPKLTQKLKDVKAKFGIDLKNMSLKEVRENPLANVLVSRLYYMNDPNPIPTTVEGIGKYWEDYYNTSADVHGTSDYFNKAVKDFNYKSYGDHLSSGEAHDEYWESEEGQKRLNKTKENKQTGGLNIPSENDLWEKAKGFDREFLKKNDISTYDDLRDFLKNNDRQRIPNFRNHPQYGPHPNKPNLILPDWNPPQYGPHPENPLPWQNPDSWPNQLDPRTEQWPNQPVDPRTEQWPKTPINPDRGFPNPKLTPKERRWPGYDPDMERRGREHGKALKEINRVPGSPGLSTLLDIPMDKDLAKYMMDKNEWHWQNPKRHDPNDPNAPDPWQLLKNPTNKQMGGSMMSNPSMYQQMQQLPGGTMQQIPGSDAVEFIGQTHKQGGILMDAETEVENGETMDKVTMKDGEDKDYFFSSYLKKGGQSYANIHKEILSRGGNQEEINYLAAMQEKAAKRSPNKIAKLGGIAMYAEGGFDETDPSKKEKKAFQKERHAYYQKEGGTLSFRKWNKQNPFDLNLYMGIDNEPVIEEPVETIGLRQDLPGAYGYRADAGDGYTICQSGNCQDGTGVMYTYYAENLDENDSPMNAEGTIIGMYEGEFKDGKPVGQGTFTWNDVDQSLEDGVPFVPWSYSSTGEFKVDATGHPELVSGTKDWGDIGVSTGVFTDGKLVSGTTTRDGKLINTEDGKEVSKLSKTVRKDLVEKGLLEKIPFKYSQGDIGTEYKKMKNASGYTQPTQAELQALGYNSFDEFRADYERLTDASYDWKNITHWGKQHEDALGKVKKGIAEGFTTTGTFTPPVVEEKTEPLTYEETMATVGPGTGPQIPCPCAPEYHNYNVPEGVDCFGCEDKIVDEEDKGRKGLFGFDDNTVPGLAIASGLAQTVPAIYAMTHKQPDPDMVPFESGVTSPIVPGRLRAKKLSHINMNQQRSANDARLREMNQFIDTSGGGPATMANRMAAWGKKHEGDMQIAAQEKQANIGIENQNVAVENQTNLHNLKMEQEAALGNAQMQMSEAQRLNEVNAINTAAKNKIKDDEEYMKYAGVISAAQGVGSMFSDMLAYKGDMLRAQGYGIDGTTNRMLLRRQLGKTIYNPLDGSVFCEHCTNEDIARYEKTFTGKQSPHY